MDGRDEALQTSRVIQKLQECIALPSPTPPGEVRAVADWVEAWCTEFGAEVERQTVESGKDNVVVTLDFGPGKTLVFNTHMDVNDPSGQIWESPPFTPRLENGLLFGRGTCDAKGSLVAMIAAMENLANNPNHLAGKLTLTAVMGEEAGGIGSLHLVQAGLTADGAVVGEPTNLHVCTSHKGTYMRRVNFRGRAAHSGRPELGINAVLHASAFCVTYDRLNDHFRNHPHPQLGPSNATVTVFQGGNRQNTVPASATVIVDRRLIPGESSKLADDELDSVIQKTRTEFPDLDIESIEVIVSTVPSETHITADIVQVGLDAMTEITGHPRESIGFSAGCDMSKLVHYARIPTIILGPGSLREAHAPDEFVEVSEVEQAVSIYERIGRGFLRADRATETTQDGFGGVHG